MSTAVARVRQGVRRSANWFQLVRFCAVGATGYAVNLVTFALCSGALDMDYRAAATIAFLVAVTNNFLWNRRWTFRMVGGGHGWQAFRFLVVSAAAFVVNVVLLQLLVEGAGMAELGAQAISVGAAAPLGFAGHKLWTFA